MTFSGTARAVILWVAIVTSASLAQDGERATGTDFDTWMAAAEVVAESVDASDAQRDGVRTTASRYRENVERQIQPLLDKFDSVASKTDSARSEGGEKYERLHSDMAALRKRIDGSFRTHFEVFLEESLEFFADEERVLLTDAAIAVEWTALSSALRQSGSRLALADVAGITASVVEEVANDNVRYECEIAISEMRRRAVGVLRRAVGEIWKVDELEAVERTIDGVMRAEGRTAELIDDRERARRKRRNGSRRFNEILAEYDRLAVNLLVSEIESVAGEDVSLQVLRRIREKQFPRVYLKWYMNDIIKGWEAAEVLTPKQVELLRALAPEYSARHDKMLADQKQRALEFEALLRSGAEIHNDDRAAFESDRNTWPARQGAIYADFIDAFSDSLSDDQRAALGLNPVADPA